MIAEKTLVIYNSKRKEIIAEIEAGWEYFTNEDVFEGSLEQFQEKNPEYGGERE